eukprot:Nk52_evm9s277 gene=Nk52_evmTU9s277
MFGVHLQRLCCRYCGGRVVRAGGRAIGRGREEIKRGGGGVIGVSQAQQSSFFRLWRTPLMRIQERWYRPTRPREAPPPPPRPSSSSTSSSSGPPPEPPADSLLLRLQALDDHFRYRGYSVLRIGTLFLVSGGAYVYIFQDDIKDKAAVEISDVAQRSLNDDQMREKAQELSKSVVHEVLSDARTVDTATSFVKDLSGKDDLRRAVVLLLQQIMADPVLLNEVNRFVGLIVRDILEDEEVYQKVLDMINRLMVDPMTKEYFVKLMWMTMADPYFQKYTADFTRWVFSTPEVSGQFYKLAVDSAMWTFSDPDVQNQATQWFVGILQNNAVHEHGGDAVWNVFMRTITPSIFRGGGGDGKETGGVEGGGDGAVKGNDGENDEEDDEEEEDEDGRRDGGKERAGRVGDG